MLFFYYAHPCAPTRRSRKLISEVDERIMEGLIQNKIAPSRQLLEQWFPDAVRSLILLYGLDEYLNEPWPVEIVRTFWRAHKGKDPRCATFCGPVVAINGIAVRVKVLQYLLPVSTFNYYAFPVALGDTAYFHINRITEVEPQKKVKP